MIKVENKKIKITGSADEFRQDLIALHLTIMEDKELLEIGIDAVKEAHSIFISNKFESTDLKDGKR